jgi:hypothetical protein
VPTQTDPTIAVTSSRVVDLVTRSVSLLCHICVLTLSICLLRDMWVNKTIDSVLLTSFISITTALIGYLTGVLTSTKSVSPPPPVVPPTPEAPILVSPVVTAPIAATQE